MARFRIRTNWTNSVSEAHEFTLDDLAEAARRLVALRERWLNPPEWVEWVEEPAPGYPKRPAARDEAAAKALKVRTLTSLYNTRPQWLADAHAALDAAVAETYGWPEGIRSATSREPASGSGLAGIAAWPPYPLQFPRGSGQIFRGYESSFRCPDSIEAPEYSTRLLLRLPRLLTRPL